MDATNGFVICDAVCGDCSGGRIIVLRGIVKKDFSKRESFGMRLAEERKRLGMRQAEFSALVGTDVPKQSLYENDRRELRGDYLAKLAAAGVDIVYVLTGRRNGGEWLGQGASELLDAYLSLPPEMQDALDLFVRALRDQFDRPQGATVHGPRLDYRTEDERR